MLYVSTSRLAQCALLLTLIAFSGCKLRLTGSRVITEGGDQGTSSTSGGRSLTVDPFGSGLFGQSDCAEDCLGVSQDASNTAIDISNVTPLQDIKLDIKTDDYLCAAVDYDSKASDDSSYTFKGLTLTSKCKVSGQLLGTLAPGDYVWKVSIKKLSSGITRLFAFRFHVLALRVRLTDTRMNIGSAAVSFLVTQDGEEITECRASGLPAGVTLERLKTGSVYRCQVTVNPDSQLFKSQDLRSFQVDARIGNGSRWTNSALVSLVDQRKVMVDFGTKKLESTLGRSASISSSSAEAPLKSCSFSTGGDLGLVLEVDSANNACRLSANATSLITGGERTLVIRTVSENGREGVSAVNVWIKRGSFGYLIRNVTPGFRRLSQLMIEGCVSGQDANGHDYEVEIVPPSSSTTLRARCVKATDGRVPSTFASFTNVPIASDSASEMFDETGYPVPRLRNIIVRQDIGGEVNDYTYSTLSDYCSENNGTTPTFYGTPRHYYVCNYEQLNGLRNLKDVGTNNMSWTAHLVRDVSAPVNAYFRPLGSVASGTTGIFRGVFLGHGRSLRNLAIRSSRPDAQREPMIGFFSILDRATVSNLRLDNASVMGYYGVGLIAGRAQDSLIEKITVSNSGTCTTLTSTALSSPSAPVSPNCIGAAGALGATGVEAVGGLVGVLDGQLSAIRDNSLTNVEINGVFNVGGVIGLGQYVENVIGNQVRQVLVHGATNLGLLAGALYSTSVGENHLHGLVFGTPKGGRSVMNVGGAIGILAGPAGDAAPGIASNLVVQGEVYAQSGFDVGGAIGLLGDAVVRGIRSYASVQAPHGDRAGGLIGRAYYTKTPKVVNAVAASPDASATPVPTETASSTPTPVDTASSAPEAVTEAEVLNALEDSVAVCSNLLPREEPSATPTPSDSPSVTPSGGPSDLPSGGPSDEPVDPFSPVPTGTQTASSESAELLVENFIPSRFGTPANPCAILTASQASSSGSVGGAIGNLSGSGTPEIRIKGVATYFTTLEYGTRGGIIGTSDFGASLPGSVQISDAHYPSVNGRCIGNQNVTTGCTAHGSSQEILNVKLDGDAEPVSCSITGIAGQRAGEQATVDATPDFQHACTGAVTHLRCEIIRAGTGTVVLSSNLGGGCMLNYFEYGAIPGFTPLAQAGSYAYRVTANNRVIVSYPFYYSPLH